MPNYPSIPSLEKINVLLPNLCQFAIFSGLTTEKPAAAAAAAAVAAKKNLTTWTCFSYPMRKSQWVSGKKFMLFSSYKQKTIGGGQIGPPL